MREIFNYASSFSIALPVIAGLYYYRYHSAAIRVLIYFFFLGAVNEAVMDYLSMIRKNNLGVMNVFVLIEFSVFAWISLQAINSRFFTRIGYAVTGFFIIAWLYTTFFIYTIFEFNNIIYTTEGVLLIFFSGFALLKISSDVRVSIIKNPHFWIESAILIYFSANLIVFSLADLILSKDALINREAWIIHSCWNIFANIIFSIGLLCNSKKLTYS